MPVLRAIALFGFLLGTVLLTYGILVDIFAVAIAGVAAWAAGVGIGLLAHRLTLKAR